MGKLFSIEELRAEKDGTITPLVVVESTLEWIRNNPGDIERIAIVVSHKDGVINTAMSTMGYLELIGLHATAQVVAIEEMDD